MVSSTDARLAWRLQVQEYIQAACESLEDKARRQIENVTARDGTSYLVRRVLGDRNCFFHAVNRPSLLNRVTLTTTLIKSVKDRSVRKGFAVEIRQFLYIGLIAGHQDEREQAAYKKIVTDEFCQLIEALNTAEEQLTKCVQNIRESKQDTDGKTPQELFLLFKRDDSDVSKQFSEAYKKVAELNHQITKHCYSRHVFRNYVRFYLDEAEGFIPFSRRLNGEEFETPIDVINCLFHINIQILLNDGALVTQRGEGPPISILHNGIDHFDGLDPHSASHQRPLQINDIVEQLPRHEKPATYIINHLLKVGYADTVYQLVVLLEQVTRLMVSNDRTFKVRVEALDYRNLDDIIILTKDDDGNDVVNAFQVKHYQKPIQADHFVDKSENAKKHAKMHVGKFLEGWLAFIKKGCRNPQILIYSNINVDGVLEKCLTEQKDQFSDDFISKKNRVLLDGISRKDFYDLMFEQGKKYLQDETELTDDLFRTFLHSFRFFLNQEDLEQKVQAIMGNLKQLAEARYGEIRIDQLFLNLYYAVHEWFIHNRTSRTPTELTYQVLSSLLEKAQLHLQNAVKRQSVTETLLRRVNDRAGDINVKRSETVELERSELSPTEFLLDSRSCGEHKRKKQDSKITLKECASKRPRTSFEDQLAQSMDELRQVEEEWQIYQYNFALNHMEGAIRLNETDWIEFRKALKENFNRRLKCCEAYDEGQHEIVDDLYFWRPKVLVHQKYVLQGALNFMDGNVDQAVSLFSQAIRFSPERLLAWLFLASALYRLERYQDVITLVESYCRDQLGDSLMLLGPYRPSREFVFSLYSQFSLLTDDCIEQNFLQFTHATYINTEMHYYHAKARCALSPRDPENQRSLATVFNRRGVECMMGGWYHQAVFNFEKAKELHPDRFFGDHYAKSLYVIGRIDDALQELKNAVEMTSDDGQRVKYLNRLIDYFIQYEQIGEADAYLDQIPENRLSHLLHVHLAYLRTKVKLSLKNPSFSALKNGVEEFFYHYQKLSLSCQEREAGPWLMGCLKLGNNFCEDSVARGKIDDIIQTHRLFIGIFEQLIASLEKAFFPDRQLKKEAHFPNRIYDRLYLKYFTFLMQQYLMFASLHNKILQEFDISPDQNRMSEQLLSDYKAIEGKIKDKLQLYQLRRALLETDESEVFQRHKFLAQLIKTIDALASEDKPESAEARNSISTDIEQATLDEMIRDYEELLSAVPDKTTFLDLYRSNLREVQISCANTEENFIDMHVSNVSFILQYGFWPNFIKLLTLKETDITSQVSSFESVSRAIEAWLSILTIYKTTIEDEPHPVLKKAHLKAIDDCQMHFFPSISRILLEYFNRLQAAGCSKLALKAVEHLKSLVPPLRGALQELSSSQQKQLELLIRNFDEVLPQASQITSQRSLKEVSEQLQAHPLDLFYGNNSSPYRVPFPNQQIIDSLRQLKQAEKIQENVNLSVHYLTVVYHRRAPDGTKGPRKTCHLPLTPRQEFFTAEQLRYPNQEYMDRIERGYQIYQSTSAQVKEDLTLSFQEAEIKHDFDPFYHRHSEQAFFEWLSLENPNQLIAQIRQKEPEFRTDCKVDMVAFDTGSSFASCLHCRLSALSMQSGKEEQGDFLARLEEALLKQRFHLPRERDGVRLKAVTRILADTRRQEDRAFPHTNPKERNVKHLKNLGLFQHIVNGVFASGSSHKVKKQ